MSTVGRGGQIRLTVNFYEFQGGSLFDPQGTNEPTLKISIGSTAVLGPLHYDGVSSIVREQMGVYSYVWTVATDAALGTYTVEWSGTIHGSTTKGIELVEVVAAGDADAGSSSPTLEEDFFATFLAELDPMYIAVDEIQPFFPDASQIEIAEQIHIASSEVKGFLKGVSTPTPEGIDYVKAATACALSRIYEYGFGGEELGVKLGDLSISARAMPKQNVTRGNASTWCELAAALREEMLSSQGGRANLKAADKGSNLANPMPSRGLRRHD